MDVLEFREWLSIHGFNQHSLIRIIGLPSIYKDNDEYVITSFDIDKENKCIHMNVSKNYKDDDSHYVITKLNEHFYDNYTIYINGYPIERGYVDALSNVYILNMTFSEVAYDLRRNKTCT